MGTQQKKKYNKRDFVVVFFLCVLSSRRKIFLKVISMNKFNKIIVLELRKCAYVGKIR